MSRYAQGLPSAVVRLFILSLGLLLGSAMAQEPDGPIASPEPGWPQWKGPRRDGISDEKGLLAIWPAQGPTLLWTASGLGRGYSSPVISNGTLYITGDVGQELKIFALDLTGKVQWTSRNGEAWNKSHPGARACCAISQGKLLHINGFGRTACLDASTGKELWSVDTAQQFGGQDMSWGRSECVLVDETRVIVTPGGTKAFMVALDRGTGATVWRSEPFADSEVQKTSYCSPILFGFGGRRLLANASLRSMVCVDALTGKMCWTFPERSKYDANCATPVYWEGAIFHTIPSGAGGFLLKMVSQGATLRADKVWDCQVDNVSGGAVCVKGYFYSSGEENPGWACVDGRTGKQTYVSKTLASGSVIFADGSLYCLGEDGEMALVKAHPDGFDVVSRFRLVQAKEKDCWAHPVLLDGRLYLRYHDTLYCYDVKGSP